jgi:predicted esterase
LTSVLPTAPQQPVTLNGGRVMTSWFDIPSLERVDDVCRGIEESRSKVMEILEEEHRLGIAYSRMFLGGE